MASISYTIQRMSREDERKIYDCAILGAGPAGLCALTYLARFHRSAVALGATGKHSRLHLIDRTYNLPGYPQGISGQDLLNNLQHQAESVGGEIRGALAASVQGSDGDFTVELENGEPLNARKIILAMGVHDRTPDIPGVENHVGEFVRYCPVCDGYEHTGKQLGLLGSGKSAVRHALFLRTFSPNISVFLHGEPSESLGEGAAQLTARGIAFHAARVAKISELIGDDNSPQRGNGVILDDGEEHPLDVLYSALGCDVNLRPVQGLDLELDEEGYIITDYEQKTNINGIYAIGDIVSQYNQISIAFGQATVAAISIHNILKPE